MISPNSEGNDLLAAPADRRPFTPPGRQHGILRTDDDGLLHPHGRLRRSGGGMAQRGGGTPLGHQGYTSMAVVLVP